jgi:ribosomal protein L27
MAHKKGVGSSKNGRESESKRLGVKIFGGQAAIAGNIIVRQLPGGEIQPAMKTGLIDAAEFNNPTSDSQFGMQDVSKHYHLGSFHQSQEMFEIPMNTKRLKRTLKRE